MSPVPAVPWDLVGSVIQQGGESLDGNEVRWSLRLPGGSCSYIDKQAFKEQAKLSFREHMHNAFPNVHKYPAVSSMRSDVFDNADHFDLDISCEGADIDAHELFEQARNFELAGLDGPLGRPKVMGTDVSEDITVITVKDVKAADLEQFKRHIDAAISKQLSVWYEGHGHFVKVIDLWRVKEMVETSDRAGVEFLVDTDEVGVVVQVYEWVNKHRARPRELVADELSIISASRETTRQVPIDYLLRVGSRYSAIYYWPGWLKVGKLPIRFLMEFPGRYSYCPDDRCIIEGPMHMQGRHEEVSCPYCAQCGYRHFGSQDGCPQLLARRPGHERPDKRARLGGPSSQLTGEWYDEGAEGS